MTVSRRSFLAASTAAAFGVPAVGALGAADTINVGLIGTGGRCRHLVQALAKVPKVRMAAVCDVYDPHLAEGAKLAHPKAFQTKKYKELLDRKDIDAVLIATPDHWHVPMTVDACAAGKDVYVEKPLTHEIGEGQAVLDAVAKHKTIVQVGTQQRSMPHIIKAAELVRDGRLGKVHKVRLTWNRNGDRGRRTRPKIDPKTVNWADFLGSARKQPFDAYRFRGWRWFWDFGGGIFTDLMVHFLDVAHWFLGLDHPLKAASVGSFVTAKGLWETPDTVQTLLVYPGGLQVHFEGTFCNARHGAMIEFMGDDATLYVDRGCYEVLPEVGVGRGKAEELVVGKGRRGQDFYDKPDGELLHLTNWIDCVRSRKAPTSPVAAGVSAAAAAHLANQALRGGGVAEWKKAGRG
jgi:predicted dehydrogenase